MQGATAQNEHSWFSRNIQASVVQLSYVLKLHLIPKKMTIQQISCAIFLEYLSIFETK